MRKLGENNPNGAHRIPATPLRIIVARSNLIVDPSPRACFIIRPRGRREGMPRLARNSGEVQGLREEVQKQAGVLDIWQRQRSRVRTRNFHQCPKSRAIPQLIFFREKNSPISGSTIAVGHAFRHPCRCWEEKYMRQNPHRVPHQRGKTQPGRGITHDRRGVARTGKIRITQRNCTAAPPSLFSRIQHHVCPT